MYYWHGTREAEHNCYWSVVKSYTLVLFFLLCRYLHCCLQAGNDSDTMWHFLGWQCAELNETSYCSFPTPWALSAQQMRKTHFRLGRWGKGRWPCWTDLPSPTTHSQSHRAASPALALCIQECSSCGNWGLVSCGFTEGLVPSDMRNGLFFLTLCPKITDKSQPPHSG